MSGCRTTFTSERSAVQPRWKTIAAPRACRLPRCRARGFAEGLEPCHSAAPALDPLLTLRSCPGGLAKRSHCQSPTRQGHESWHRGQQSRGEQARAIFIEMNVIVMRWPTLGIGPTVQFHCGYEPDVVGIRHTLIMSR